MTCSCSHFGNRMYTCFSCQKHSNWNWIEIPWCCSDILSVVECFPVLMSEVQCSALNTEPLTYHSTPERKTDINFFIIQVIHNSHKHFYTRTGKLINKMMLATQSWINVYKCKFQSVFLHKLFEYIQKIIEHSESFIHTTIWYFLMCFFELDCYNPSQMIKSYGFAVNERIFISG